MKNFQFKWTFGFSGFAFVAVGMIVAPVSAEADEVVNEKQLHKEMRELDVKRQQALGGYADAVEMGRAGLMPHGDLTGREALREYGHKPSFGLGAPSFQTGTGWTMEKRSTISSTDTHERAVELPAGEAEVLSADLKYALSKALKSSDSEKLSEVIELTMQHDISNMIGDGRLKEATAMLSTLMRFFIEKGNLSSDPMSQKVREQLRAHGDGILALNHRLEELDELLPDNLLAKFNAKLLSVQ